MNTITATRKECEEPATIIRDAYKRIDKLETDIGEIAAGREMEAAPIPDNED